jgi:hypothetical protein
MNFLGDFSRCTFNPGKRFTRVLQQQGRAQLDADWNEQSAIFWHHMRALAEDIGGPHWGPAGNAGFRIEPLKGGTRNFFIHPGAYYVRGARCQNGQRIQYVDQLGAGKDDLQGEGRGLVYLEVWERHVSHIEDRAIREVALGGADTAVRAELAWQVRFRADWQHELGDTRDMTHDELVAALFGDQNRPRLVARAGLDEEQGDEPCPPSSGSGYRGPENQLYRVEIHRGGRVGDATFKWSRDNAVTFAVERRKGTVLTLADLGRDARLSLNVDDWVEVLDDRSERRSQPPPPLLRVKDVAPERREVILSQEPSEDVGSAPALHPRLRRWDHRAGRPEEGGAQLVDGAALVREGKQETAWIELEDGIRIQFQPASEDGGVEYRSGDYWWIPARTATGGIEWPQDESGQPLALEPHGVERAYAPLAIVEFLPSGSSSADTRWFLQPARFAPGDGK